MPDTGLQTYIPQVLAMRYASIDCVILYSVDETLTVIGVFWAFVYGLSTYLLVFEHV